MELATASPGLPFLRPFMGCNFFIILSILPPPPRLLRIPESSLPNIELRFLICESMLSDLWVPSGVVGVVVVRDVSLADLRDGLPVMALLSGLLHEHANRNAEIMIAGDNFEECI